MDNNVVTQSDDHVPSDGAIARYLAGECSTEEDTLVSAWIRRDPTSALVVEALRVRFSEGTARPDHERMHTLDARIRAAVHELSSRGEGTRTNDHGRGHGMPISMERVDHKSRQEHTRRKGRTGFAIRIPRSLWIGVSAGVALLAFLMLGRHTPVGHTSSPRTYATKTGQRAIVTLREGIRVTLAPRTTLSLQGTKNGVQAVALDGEAYFEVPSAGTSTFVVQTGDVSTRVLGTSFSVRHYGNDRAVRVAVVNGKVSVASQTFKRAQMVLTAGVTGTVLDSIVTTQSGDVTQSTGWLTGRLVFHKAPASEVLATLSRWYGYQFKLADSTIATKVLTVGLTTQSSQEALTTLKMLLDVDLTFDGNIITLVPRPDHPSAPASRRDGRDLLTPYAREVGR